MELQKIAQGDTGLIAANKVYDNDAQIAALATANKQGLEDITKEVINTEVIELNESNIELGTFEALRFVKSTSTTRLRSKTLIYRAGLRSVKVDLPAGFKFALRIFNEQGEQILDTFWQSSGTTYNIFKNGYYFLLLLRKDPDGAIDTTVLTSDFKVTLNYAKLNNVYPSTLLTSLELGTYTSTGGYSTGSIAGTRVRSKGGLLAFENDLALTPGLGENYSYWVKRYRLDSTFVDDYKGMQKGDGEPLILPKGYLYRFIYLTNPADEQLTVEDVSSKLFIDLAANLDQGEVDKIFRSEKYIFTEDNFSQGGWSGTRIKNDGTQSPSTYLYRIGCNENIKRTGGLYRFNVPSGYQVAIFAFTGSTGYDTTWQLGGFEIDLSEYDYFNISVAKGGPINVSELTDDFNYEAIITYEELYNKVYTSQDSQANSSQVFARKKIANIIAHRGFHLIAPENTLDAYIHAGRMGYEIAETDFCPTLDNELVLMHDATINRTMRNSDYTAIASAVNVKDLTLEQLRSNYVLASNYLQYRKPIPTLEEFYITCKNAGIFPLPEIKTSGTTQAHVLKAFEMGRKILGVENFGFCSFSYALLDYARTLDPNLKLYYIGSSILGTVNSINGESRENPNNIWYWQYNVVTKSEVESYHEKGLKVATWTTPANNFDVQIDNLVDEIAGDYIGPNIKTSTNCVSSDLDFKAFKYEGEVINGVLNLTTNQTVKYGSGVDMFLGGYFLEITFKGSINIISGSLSKNLTSTEIITKIFQSPIYGGSNSFTIKALSENTQVYEIHYAESKF